MKTNKKTLITSIALVLSLILLLLLLNSCTKQEGALDTQNVNISSEETVKDEREENDPAPVEEAKNEEISEEEKEVDKEAEDTEKPSENGNKEPQAAAQQQAPAQAPQAPQQTQPQQSATQQQAAQPQNNQTNTTQQQHTHTWVAITEQKWVVDKAAYDEQVLVKEAWDEIKSVAKEVPDHSEWVCNCGVRFLSVDEMSLHSFAHLDKDEPSNNSVDTIYKTIWEDQTIHHDAEYTTVHHAEEGHYETVTAGYKCSTCGATK